MGTTPPKGEADYLVLGSWNAICAQCGRKRKADQMKRLPPGVPASGMYVCPEHYDSRQPQDFVRGVPDKMTPPWVQSISDAFIYTCDLQTRMAMTGVAISGCAESGFIPNNAMELLDGWVA